MKNLLNLGVFLAFAVVVSGCATIIHGSYQEVSVSSTPTNAVVSVNGEQMGNTPTVLDLKRKKKHIISVELDGYEPYDLTLKRKATGWIAGNLVFGGLVGLGIDALTGGMYKLSPGQITAALGDGAMGVAEDEGRLYVTIVLQPDPEWEKIGQLERTGD